MLIARIFPRPCGARKNTAQLAKYPHVLYAKPSNKVYIFQIRFLSSLVMPLKEKLSAKILALLRLSVNFFQLRLTKKLKIYFFSFKELNIDKPVFFVS